MSTLLIIYLIGAFIYFSILGPVIVRYLAKKEPLYMGPLELILFNIFMATIWPFAIIMAIYDYFYLSGV